jgi:hypothetical protein
MAINCKDCGMILQAQFCFDGQCYKCYEKEQRQPLVEEIQQLREQVKRLTDWNAAKRFWVVLRDSDSRLRRHATKQDAEHEAERLAACNPGNTFFALGVASGFRIGLRPDKLTIEEGQIASRHSR